MREYNQFEVLVKRFPILECCLPSLADTHKELSAAFRGGKKLLVCGNGGSCADADHIVGELMKGFVKKRVIPTAVSDKLKALDAERGNLLSDMLQMSFRAINLCQHTALNSAFSNDRDPSMIYAQQVLGYVDSGDVFLGISTSGNAENVYLAALTAKVFGAVVIGLTGEDGGNLGKIADILINVPGRCTYQIQELHLPVYHALCLSLEEEFFHD